ncbi:MAG: hypothetical protein OXI34_02095 [Chloroflexota bacterium]|nr:hypothetical protein [Chloroflexota bacterium]MDE2947198.1 hypothetical protein [Chloroflexota bacterium]
MDMDKMRRGIIPGIIAGYLFLAFIGASMVPSLDVTMSEGGDMVASVEQGAPMMNNGMLEMVGGMIGADALIGFILHIIISAVIGGLYTGIFMQYVDLGNPLYNIAVGGLIYGVIWWIVGGLIIMPAIAGGDLLQIDLNSPSLFGHIMFGHALAFLVVIRDAAMGMGDDE